MRNLPMSDTIYLMEIQFAFIHSSKWRVEASGRERLTVKERSSRQTLVALIGEEGEPIEKCMKKHCLALFGTGTLGSR